MGGGANWAQKSVRKRPEPSGLKSKLVSRGYVHLEPTSSRQTDGQRQHKSGLENPVTIQPLKQGLTHLLCKGPTDTCFRLWGPRGPEPTSYVWRVCHSVNLGERKGLSPHPGRQSVGRWPRGSPALGQATQTSRAVRTPSGNSVVLHVQWQRRQQPEGMVGPDQITRVVWTWQEFCSFFFPLCLPSLFSSCQFLRNLMSFQ